MFFHEEPKRFVGVHFDNSRSKYVGQTTHEGKHYWCGYFSNELETAQAVNLKCVELDIPLKNQEVGLPENKPQVRFKQLRQQNLMFCFSVFRIKDKILLNLLVLRSTQVALNGLLIFVIKRSITTVEIF